MSLKKIIKGNLLKFFTKKKKKYFNIKESKKILILKDDRIGDMIILTPVFRELKSAYPEIKISVMASSVNKDVIRYNPHIDKVYVSEASVFFKYYQICRYLRKEKFELEKQIKNESENLMLKEIDYENAN